MSFKVDNVGIYPNLNDQQVKELLSSHIPQDEAKLLCNGRLTCLICIHRPIFDTINMLSIHRKSKKHLQELSKHIKCKEDAIVRGLQRKNNLEENKTEQKTTSFLPSSLRIGPVLGSKHAEAKSLKINGRKPTLELKPRPLIKHKTIEKPKESKSVNSTVKNYLKTMSRKSTIEKAVEWSRDHYGKDLQKQVQEDVQISSGERKCSGVVTLKNDSLNLANGGSATPAVNSSQNYELNLRMSGWIKDKGGIWVKDPEAEFDSDDEIPPPPT